ncbi:MAG: hypothetical protein SGCHY_001388 [Lobulomycetales sp.]
MSLRCLTRFSTGTKSASTVERGTRFELLALAELTRLSFQLTRSGGANDLGVDLFGFWKLGPRVCHPVIVQCKCEARRVGTSYLRELEGSLSRRAPNEVGFLVSSGGFTKNSISYASGSKLRLVLVTMHHDDGFIKEFRMNAPAKEQLSGISCAVERTADQVACLRLTYRSRLLGE